MRSRRPHLIDAPATIVHGEALDVLGALPSGCAGLVYVDPPFNTGRRRTGLRLSTARDENGTRRGFAGRRYRVAQREGESFEDSFDDSYTDWLKPRLVETRRILAEHGSLYFHIDPRESHYCKVLLDTIFGRRCFLNEIVWAYDFGGRAQHRWAAKHDVLLVYVRDPRAYHFDPSGVDRIAYMAPGLQTEERAARGKLPTDVWWQTIVPTTSRERTGYPTQKPLAVLRRVITASSRPGDLIVDWCGGSGTAAVAAAELGRRFLVADTSADAVAVMRTRLASVPGLRVLSLAQLLSL